MQSEQAITRNLADTQEVRAAYNVLREPWYRAQAERYGKLATEYATGPWLDVPFAYKWSRLAGHFAGLVLDGGK